ncbi:hypothetical protein ACOMHN_004416 [Nucella lapillus]
MVEPGYKGCEILLTLRLHASLLSAYAPTLTSTPEAEDAFYTKLNGVIENVHNEHFVLLGDFNARVGADHDAWPSCLGLWSWQDP